VFFLSEQGYIHQLIYFHFLHCLALGLVDRFYVDNLD